MNISIYKDPSIIEILETRFHNDKEKFVEAIKEYNLLKSFDRGELSIGQISNILNISKYEVMEHLEKYDIPFIRVDEEYIENEFSAFD